MQQRHLSTVCLYLLMPCIQLTQLAAMCSLGGSARAVHVVTHGDERVLH